MTPGLLPQPGGFEGLGFLMFEVDLDPGCAAIRVQGPNRPHDEIEVDAASRSSDRIVLPDQDLVSSNTEIQRLHHLRLERVWLHPRAKPCG